MYPPTGSHQSGKLRLLYEANPIAMIAEQAGGVALDGQSRILDIKPTEVHQRTPMVVGSQHEMELYRTYLDGSDVCAPESLNQMNPDSTPTHQH